MGFSEAYFRLFEEVPAFHDRVTRKYSLESRGASISERLLRCVWFDRLYSAHQLATTDGKKIVVHSPGTWNLERGPDFKRADITIGEHRLKGDVELHLDPAGWRQHRHAQDPEYDAVILHVTLSAAPDQPPALSRHGVEIPGVALWDCLTDDLRVLRCALRPEEYPYRSTQNYGRCQPLLAQTLPTTIQGLLCLAGDARMLVKQRRFAYEAERTDLDQVAYTAVLEGMGYKAYTEQFGRLARKLPYARLRERTLAAHGNGGVLLTQALLLGAAGLLPEPHGRLAPEARQYTANIQHLWRAHSFDDVRADDISWKASAVRPANLPQRRIAGISYVLARSYGHGLFASILERVLHEDAKTGRAACLDYLTHADDDFWLHHYSARGKRLNRPVGLIGRNRALTIIVNSFVPLGLLHARRQANADSELHVHRFYCQLPSLPPNNITRLMEYKLFGSPKKRRVARSARTQQGLLQMFADWCSEDPACENCGIFAALESGNLARTVSRSEPG